ncbi:hypothetical protein TSMEX_007551, partial [Taenia solium]
EQNLGVNGHASELRKEEPHLLRYLECSFWTHKRDELEELCRRESEKLVKRGAECSSPSTPRVNSPGGAQKLRKLDLSDVTKEMAAVHPRNARPYNVRRHILRNHSGKAQAKRIIGEEASATVKEYLPRRKENGDVGHTADHLSGTKYEESRSAAHLIADEWCCALCVGGRVRRNRGVTSSGVWPASWFGFSTTTATVAVVSSTVDADGTAITTAITEGGGNIEASTEGWSTAAHVGDDAELM